MSGTFCFGDDLVVVVNNAGMGVLDNLLRPFLRTKKLAKKYIFIMTYMMAQLTLVC